MENIRNYCAIVCTLLLRGSIDYDEIGLFLTIRYGTLIACIIVLAV